MYVPGSVSTPADFLKAIGRSSETKLSFGSWEALWKTSGHDLKAAGLSVHDRRCAKLQMQLLCSPVPDCPIQIHFVVYGEIQKWVGHQ
jgi:hypothetical protein